MKMTKRRKGKKRMLSVSLILLMTVTLFAGIPAKDMEEVEAAATVSSPRIVEDASMESGQKVTWDCVWFGSYPQAEVITSAMSENYTSVNSAYRKDGDVVVSNSVYTALENATGWDANNDITLNGTKYRRMKKGDATYSYSSSSYYSWSDSTTYHYFQYQPIKWRVLNVDGNDAFLLSDTGLDDRKYNQSYASVTWETSTIRSWLNGYGVSDNAYGDYSSSNFIDSAFSTAEQGAIQTTALENADNSYYGTSGGNDTTDKIFLLSESEIYGTDAAKSYGFSESCIADDKARRRKSSTYAKAMGVVCSSSTSTDDDLGDCSWWLRSPGGYFGSAMVVRSYSWVVPLGIEVDYYISAVCPALHLNLSSSNLWSYAGTVSSDGSVDEIEKGDTTGGDTSSDLGKVASFTIDSDASGSLYQTITLSGSLKLKEDVETSSSILSSEVSKITWTYSDASVAEVTDCAGVNATDNRSAKLLVTVTPKKEGVVTITGTTANGLTASCEVTIRDTILSEFTLDSQKQGTLDNMPAIEGTLKLLGNVETSSAILQAEVDAIQWESSDPFVAVVTGCKGTKSGDNRKAVLSVTLEPKKKGTTTITGTASDGTTASCEVEITDLTDSYIVRRVSRYTSDEVYEQFERIQKSNYSVEKKYQKYYELFTNYGFTDVKEGISYLSNTTPERYAYLMLTTDDCYVASQFLYEMENTSDGKKMRATLVADGILFNSEWKTWINPLTYTEGETPGVKKYKDMLYDYMDAQAKTIELASDIKTATKLLDHVTGSVKDTALKEINNCSIEKWRDTLMKYEDAFFEWDERDNEIVGLKFDSSSGFGKFAKAEGYASTTISVADMLVEDVIGLIELDGKLAAYEENKEFLNEIVKSSDDIPSELRYAAYLVCKEMEAGLANNAKDFCLDIIKTTKVTDELLTSLLKKYEFDTAAGIAGGLTSFMKGLDTAVWFSNQVVNMGTVVKKEAYVEGYVYLARHFRKRLEESKQIFLADKTEENAWNFYYTYKTLYQIRYKGEESYLAMCNVKGLAAGLAKQEINYSFKEEVVNSILKKLEDDCQFLLPEGMEMPKSVSYRSKAVVQCPVDVEVLDADGNVVVRLADQVESDITNSYGRFAVVYMPYTGDYAKVLCFNQEDGYSMRAIGTDTGLVSMDLAVTTEGNNTVTYQLNNEPVSKDMVIAWELPDEGVQKLEYQKWESDTPEQTEKKYIEPSATEKEVVKVIDVQLEQTDITLKKGGEYLLGVTVLPANADNQQVRWLSKDASIAVVKDGKVSAVGVGETKIYCISMDDSEISAVCSVIVRASGSKEDDNPVIPSEPSTENPTGQAVDDSTTERPTGQAEDDSSTRNSTGQEVDKTTTEQAATSPATDSSSTLPAVGTTKTISAGIYKVTAASSAKKEVTFVKPKNAKKTSVAIPATVKINGATYQVTAIAAKAFKNNKKIKSVTIGKNVTKIGKQAFYGCKKLSKITINTTKLTNKKVGSKAFKGIAAKATIKVPKSKLTAYKKMLKAKGVGSGVKIKKK